MKKVLSTVLLFIILTNFIFINTAYAGDVPENHLTQSEYESLSEDGEIDIQKSGNEIEKASITDTGPSLLGTIVGYIAKVVNYLPLTFQLLLTTFLECGGTIEANTTEYDIRYF